MNTGICVLAATIALVGSSTANAQINFQGLDGTSTVASVKAKFPSVTQSNECRAGEAFQKFANTTASCVELHLSKYDVANIPFEIVFMFSTSGKLHMAHLLYTWIERDADIATFNSKKRDAKRFFDQLEPPLVLKYGVPLAKTPCSFLDRDDGEHLSRCLEWQSGGQRDWSMGVDNIQLKASSDYFGNSRSVFGSISVVYKFVDRGISDRL